MLRHIPKVCLFLSAVLSATAGCGHHTKWTAWMQTGWLIGMDKETYRVERVLDGQSFAVTYRGRLQQVCIAGVKAPGLMEKGGAEARGKLADLIEGKNVRVELLPGVQYDDLGRPLANVYLDDADVAAALSSRTIKVGGTDEAEKSPKP